MEEKKKRKKRATIFQTKRVLKYWDYERHLVICQDKFKK